MVPLVCSSRVSQFFRQIPNIYKMTLNNLPQSKVLAPSTFFLVDLILKVHVAIFSMSEPN